jgi:aryl-phospho-beta-D-glucosidase BglC (GH1 family)
MRIALRSAAAIALAAVLFPACSGGKAKTPVEAHGQLRIEGGRLVDAAGKPLQLKGPSLFDVVAYGHYMNKSAMEWLREDWKATAIRLPMYLEINSYYIGETGEQALRKGIREAIATGLYVLADWHVLEARDPLKYKKESIAFFSSLAREFGDKPNIIYEICNEPNGADVTWTGSIRPYAEALIPAIRAIDPDGVIVVGTPSWSSHPEEAALDPLPYPNLMYTMHFYAGSHGQDYRDRVDAALQAGAAVIISEWGCTHSSARSRIYQAETAEWLDFMDARGLSSFSWSLADKLIDDTSILKQGASWTGGWKPGTLTEAGNLYRSYVRGQARDIYYAEDFESGTFQGGRWTNAGAGLAKGKGKGYRSDVAAALGEGESLAKPMDLSPYAGLALSFTCKSDGAASGALIKAEYLRDGTWTEAGSAKAGKGWKVYRFDLPAQAAVAGGGFRLRAEGAGPGEILVDDISLEAGRKLNARP